MGDNSERALQDWQKRALLSDLVSKGLVELQQGQWDTAMGILNDFASSEKELKAWQSGDQSEDAIKGIQRAEFQKLVWLSEMAKTPDRQPMLVRLPSGINITRQSSQVDVQRSVSSKW